MHVRVVREVDQRAPHVDHHELELAPACGRRPARARGRAAARTCRSGCRRTRGSAGPGRRGATQTGSRPRSSTPNGTPSRADGGGSCRGSSSRGSSRIGGAAGARPVLGGLGDQLAERRRRALLLGAAVHARQRRLEVQAVHGQAAARHLGGQRGRRLARDERVDRVVQAQLEPRAEVVEQRRPDLGPAVGGHHHVDAEAQAGRGQLLDLAVEHLELALERLPAVDEQEHVGERSGAAGRGHRLVARLAERLLAVLDLGPQLAHHAGDRLAVELAGDAADVRRPRQRAEQAAAEVDAVELDLRRRVAPDQRRRQRAQQRALAGPRRADHRQVAAGAGEVERERLGALLGRAVEPADDRAQPLGALAAVPPRSVVEHGVERLGAPAAAPPRPGAPAAGRRPAGRPAPAARSGRRRALRLGRHRDVVHPGSRLEHAHRRRARPR